MKRKKKRQYETKRKGSNRKEKNICRTRQHACIRRSAHQRQQFANKRHAAKIMDGELLIKTLDGWRVA